MLKDIDAKGYELLWAAKAGDMDAAVRLMRRVSTSMHKVAYEIRIWGYDHNDLVQEGRMKFLEVIKVFDRSRGLFLPFLLCCIKRHLIGLARTEKNFKRFALKVAGDLDEIHEAQHPYIDPRPDIIARDLNNSAKKFVVDHFRRRRPHVPATKVRTGYKSDDTLKMLGVKRPDKFVSLESVKQRLRKLPVPDMEPPPPFRRPTHPALLSDAEDDCPDLPEVLCSAL